MGFLEREKKGRKPKRSDWREPVLLLLKDHKIDEWRYSQGCLMVIGWFEKDTWGDYHMTPESYSYRTLRDGKLIRGNDAISLPYRRDEDIMAVGLHEIAHNIHRISNTSDVPLGDIMEKIGGWYARRIVK